jgi:hypothetical protein
VNWNRPASPATTGTASELHTQPRPRRLNLGRVVHLQALSRSPDLQRLRNEGYEVLATDRGHLVVGHVPYVTNGREVRYGQLVSKVTMAGEVAVGPVADHVAYWTGQSPCDQHGVPLPNMVNPGRAELEPGLVAECSFSCKPDTPYPDYYAKMTTYVAMLEGPAHSHRSKRNGAYVQDRRG